MTFEELKQITKQREKRTIEYKEAWSELPGNLFETVCAFLNRDGGVIVLGTHDDTPHPKNPHMANFFVQIGLAEHLGTGIRNLYKYVPIYTGKQPEIEDEDMYIVRTALPIVMPITWNHTENHTENHAGLSRIQREILLRLKANPSYSRQELASMIEKASLGGVISALKRLQELGIIRRVGPDRGGHWEIVSKDI